MSEDGDDGKLPKGRVVELTTRATTRAAVLSGQRVTPTTRKGYASAIRGAWLDAQDHFLQIGRWLIEAKFRLPHGEFEAMVSGDLPFKLTVARQLREAAEAVDSGRLGPEEDLPPSYATIYQLSLLGVEEIEAAHERGLVRRDLMRREVLEFRREFRLAGLTDRDRLRAELEDVERQIESLTRRLARLEERGGEIELLLKGPGRF